MTQIIMREALRGYEKKGMVKIILYLYKVSIVVEQGALLHIQRPNFILSMHNIIRCTKDIALEGRNYGSDALS